MIITRFNEGFSGQKDIFIRKPDKKPFDPKNQPFVKDIDPSSEYKTRRSEFSDSITVNEDSYTNDILDGNLNKVALQKKGSVDYTATTRFGRNIEEGRTFETDAFDFNYEIQRHNDGIVLGAEDNVWAGV